MLMWSLLTGYKLVKDMSWACKECFTFQTGIFNEHLEPIIPACQKWSSDYRTSVTGHDKLLKQIRVLYSRTQIVI